jgi:hypothetical protein
LKRFFTDGNGLSEETLTICLAGEYRGKLSKNEVLGGAICTCGKEALAFLLLNDSGFYKKGPAWKKKS